MYCPPRLDKAWETGLSNAVWHIVSSQIGLWPLPAVLDNVFVPYSLPHVALHCLIVLHGL